MILLAILAAAAATDEPQWNCDDPGPQQEMNYCAHQGFLFADAAMNAQWKVTSEALKAMDADGSQGDWDKRPGYFDTLLEAQRAWIKYRNAHCTSEGYIFRGGSMERFMVSSCMKTLTEERTKQLRGLVEVEG